MRISTTNVRKKDGTKLVNGYKICLQKAEVERIGMNAGTELVPKYEDGRITLTEANRIIVDYSYKDKLYCYAYDKLTDNLYDKTNYVFPMPAEVADEIEKQYKGNALPHSMIDISKRGGNLLLIWKEKKYPKDVNYI